MRLGYRKGTSGTHSRDEGVSVLTAIESGVLLFTNL